MAAEWHPSKNGELTPWDVTAGKATKVWWLGPCGHEWEAYIGHRAKGVGCGVCAGKIIIPETSLAGVNSELAAEWHPTRNGELTPWRISPRNNRKVWWLGACGHEWPALVKHRANGVGCPMCAGKVATPDMNLAVRHPALSAEWHPTRNGDLRPEVVRPGSNQAVWWLGACGHVVEARVADRVRSGGGCGVCAGRVIIEETSLATRDPQLAAQWHSTKNGTLSPTDVALNYTQPVWWRCDQGHEWQATPNSRVSSPGCARCSGRIVTPETCLSATHPDLAAEWHPTRNGELTPDLVGAGSNRSVWWLGACGHEWRNGIFNRAVRGSGCAVCRRPCWSAEATRYWLRHHLDDLQRAEPGDRCAFVSWMGFERGNAAGQVIAELLRADAPPFDELAAWASGLDDPGSPGEVIGELLDEYDAREFGGRSSIPSATRAQVLERDGRACQNPHCPTDPAVARQPGGLHIDHIIPYSQGGSHDAENLQLLCARCNLARKAVPWPDFLERERQRVSAGM